MSNFENNNEHYKVRATPAARKAATEMDVDLKDVKGSGPDGRIQAEDVYRYYEEVLQMQQHEEEKIDQLLVNLLSSKSAVDSVSEPEAEDDLFFDSAMEQEMSATDEQSSVMEAPIDFMPILEQVRDMESEPVLEEEEEDTSDLFIVSKPDLENEIQIPATAKETVTEPMAAADNTYYGMTIKSDNFSLFEFAGESEDILEDVDMALKVALKAIANAFNVESSLECNKGLCVVQYSDGKSQGQYYMNALSGKISAIRAESLPVQMMDKFELIIHDMSALGLDTFKPVCQSGQICLGLCITDEVISITLHTQDHLLPITKGALMMDNLKRYLNNPSLMLV